MTKTGVGKVSAKCRQSVGQLVGALGVVLLGAITCPAAAFSTNDMIGGMEACFAFHETGELSAFARFDEVKPVEYACHGCSTRHGRYRISETDVFLDVDQTTTGRHVGISCGIAHGHGLKVATNAVKDLNAWIGSSLRTGLLQKIDVPRFPNEAFRNCNSNSEAAALWLGNSRYGLRFDIVSGVPTGMNPEIEPCRESAMGVN
jgi:hypothetical protein